MTSQVCNLVTEEQSTHSHDSGPPPQPVVCPPTATPFPEPRLQTLHSPLTASFHRLVASLLNFPLPPSSPFGVHFHSTGKHRDPKAGSAAIWGSCSPTRQESEPTVFMDLVLVGWTWEDQATQHVSNYRKGQKWSSSRKQG